MNDDRHGAAVGGTAPPSAVGWSVGAVAERLGVEVPTLRSWEQRYGLGPRARTAGGHRRYTAADVATLQQVVRLTSSGMPTGAAAAAALHATAGSRPTAPLDGADALLARLADAADALDPTAARRLVRRVLDGRGAVAAWTDVLTPVLQTLGRRWRDDQNGIAREHLLVGVVRAELDAYAARCGSAGRGPRQVLLAAVPHEAHTLPMHALAAALAERRRCCWLFGELPADAVLAAAAEVRPLAVAVWARSREHAAPAVLRQLLACAPAVCAAGIGWPRRLPPGVVAARDLPAAVQALAGVTG